MDQVYRAYQKGQEPKTGAVMTGIQLKSIITQPVAGANLPVGPVTVLGAAYAGEAAVARVDLSFDNGKSWQAASFIGPYEPYAWRQWQFVWQVPKKGEHILLARASDSEGRQQPMNATWNVLGYGNNGVREHGVIIQIV